MMHPPAIQAALDNLVETVRTSVTAEFLEYFRGDAKPLRGAIKPKKPAPSKKAGGRPGANVEEVATLIVSHLKKNPDSGIEQISRALGKYSTKDLARPMRKLVADKTIVKRGQRRGTTYRAR